VSPADRSNRRRRRSRRRGGFGSRHQPPTDQQPRAQQAESPASGGQQPRDGEAGQTGNRQHQPHKPTKAQQAQRPRLRTVRETSAGGLVVQGLDGPRTELCAALIGRIDRRGRLLWSLPKGHIESGETAEQTAMREVAEETGIQGLVLAALGSIDYWFVTEGRRVHKTVHHYLMRSVGGELSDADVEVTEVAWVPLHELQSRLAYADERRLAVIADSLIDRMETAPVSGVDE